MKKLYAFYWDCGRMGEVTSLFIADEEEVAKAIGKNVYFGEILGKYSEVYGTLDEGDLVVKSDDQDFITKLQEVFEYTTLSGYNPLHHLQEEDE